MEIQCRNPDCGEIAIADADCLHVMKHCYRCGRRYINMRELAEAGQLREKIMDKRQNAFFTISLLFIMISGAGLLYAIYHYQLYEIEIHRWVLAGWLVTLVIFELLLSWYIKKKFPL